MPDMGKIIGQVGTGIQPGDSSVPQLSGQPLQAPVPAAQPQAMPQTPPAAPAPQGGDAPPPGETPPASPEQGGAVDDATFEKELAEMKGSTAPMQPPSMFDKVKSFIKDDIQLVKAQFRTGAARTQGEQENALTAVYGKDNVKVQGKDIWIKPDGSKRFVKFSEQQLMKSIDVMSYALNQMPEFAGKLPMSTAQMAGATGGAALGFAVGKVPGAVVGGAVGAFAGNRAGKYLEQKENEALGQDDPTFEYTNKIHDVASALSNDYVQGVMGGIGGFAFGRAAMQAAKVATLMHRGLAQEEITGLEKLTPKEETVTKAIGALRNLNDTINPATGTASEAGEKAIGASRAMLNEVGEQISVLKDSAAALQNSTGKYLQPTNFTKFVKDELSQYGVKFYPSGHVDHARTVLSQSAPSNLGPLMALNDEAINAVGSRNTGMAVEQTENFLDALKNHANYKSLAAANDSQSVYRDARVALDADRVSHYAELYGGEKSADAESFKLLMGDYSSKKSSYDQVYKILRTPEAQQLWAEKLTRAGSEASLRGVNAFEQILGTDSPEFKNVKAALVDRIIARGIDPAAGEINPRSISAFAGNKANEPLLIKLMGGGAEGQKNLGVFRSVLAQGVRKAGEETSLEATRALAVKAVELTSERLRLSGKTGFKIINAVLGNSKSGIDITKDVVLKAAQKSVEPEQKAVLMDLLNTVNRFVADADVIDVTPQIGDHMVGIKKYLPGYSARAAAAKGAGTPPPGQPSTP